MGGILLCQIVQMVMDVEAGFGLFFYFAAVVMAAVIWAALAASAQITATAHGLSFFYFFIAAVAAITAVAAQMAPTCAKHKKQKYKYRGKGAA